MLSRRDNLLALLHGERPQWTPAAINFTQWYSHHRRFNVLPPDLADSRDYIDAMKRLDLDIFSRNIDGGVREELPGVQVHTEQMPGQRGPRHVRRIDTPFGTLRDINEEQTDLSTHYVVEDWVKDWSADGKAYMWVLEHLRYRWDRQAFVNTAARVGADGLVMVPAGRSPLKKLHMDFGLDGASLFMMDEPEAADAICRLYWQRLWPVLQELAADEQVHAACIMDNVDAPFYPPALCARYWTPYVRQAADLFAARGKVLFVHACGRLHQLMDVFREAGVHGLEGMAHPPLGDFTTADARQMPPHFIYNGGFTAHEQTTKDDQQVRRHYEQYFAELRGHERFIFGAACQTAIDTPWERLKLAVELCRQHRGRPEGPVQLEAPPAKARAS